jgi:hypothetical protein
VETAFFTPEGRRRELTYQLRGQDGRLFVAQAWRSSDAVRDSFRFDVDPAQWARYDDDVAPPRLVEERTDWDERPHWFDWPEFGRYEHLMRRDLLDELWPDHDREPSERPR